MADQFSYPATFTEGSETLRRYCREIIQAICCDAVQITYFNRDVWTRCSAGVIFPKTSLENVMYRSAIQQGHFVEIQDVLNHQSYKFMVFKCGLPLIRYIGTLPIFTPCKIVTGAITLLDSRRNMMSGENILLLESFSAKIRMAADLSSSFS